LRYPRTSTNASVPRWPTGSLSTCCRSGGLSSLHQKNSFFLLDFPAAVVHIVRLQPRMDCSVVFPEIGVNDISLMNLHCRRLRFLANPCRTSPNWLARNRARRPRSVELLEHRLAPSWTAAVNLGPDINLPDRIVFDQSLHGQTIILITSGGILAFPCLSLGVRKP